ncbi:A/G-specific adenine glycosylase [Alloprevotella tannerae]
MIDTLEASSLQEAHYFAEQIEEWYLKNKRELPWRDIKDPYRIWISEIILQQTRVVQGYDYYLRFINRFPSVEDLAKADEDEVLKLWQGLGYYSRARNLHFAAKTIATSGQFPTSYKDIRMLKGVGDYTAAAIASFAYNLPYAVVDGNVYRVLARYWGVTTPIGTTEGKKLFSTLAQNLLDKKNPAQYNQALMDFGALQCVPKNPRCNNCPLQVSCVAFIETSVSTLPVKAKKTAVRTRFLIYLYTRYKDSILLHRREKGDIWQGLYEPLLIEFSESAELPSIIQKANLPKQATFRLAVKGMKHVLTHQVLIVDCYEVELSEFSTIEKYNFVPEKERANYPTSRLIELLYDAIDDLT